MMPKKVVEIAKKVAVKVAKATHGKKAKQIKKVKVFLKTIKTSLKVKKVKATPIAHLTRAKLHKEAVIEAVSQEKKTVKAAIAKEKKLFKVNIKAVESHLKVIHSASKTNVTKAAVKARESKIEHKLVPSKHQIK